jgi:hypothetical protein
LAVRVRLRLTGTIPFLPELNVRATVGARMRIKALQTIRGLKITKSYYDKCKPYTLS